MTSLRKFFTDSRTLAVLGVLIIAAMVLFLDAGTLKAVMFWMVLLMIVVLIVWLCTWAVRKLHARRAAKKVDAMVDEQGDRAVRKSQTGDKAETEVLRERMNEAVKAIKTSRLGITKGRAALYELPWYVIIGNPAAGKSTAILNSGLKFPFSDNHGRAIQGIGGTRNCDWYFTTEGIVLDTAGRYSVSQEDRFEWFSFLELLKKNRPRAPINGIIIAASIAELTGNRPEFAINLAKNLRERVQELTERLEVFAPVYVVFTKADLVAGFNEFFQTLDANEREHVWGATLPFSPDGSGKAVEQFDQHFDELSRGLKDMSLSQMALKRGQKMSPGLLTLPLEFTAIKPSLRAFVATLFEDNPYQFQPVFRGFYFTSALQEGASVRSTSERIGRRFALQPAAKDAAREPTSHSENGYFLRDLFRKVIFGDRGLVRQYSSPNRTRTRYAVFFGAALALGLALGGWTWSYMGNQQLVHNVQADLDKAVALQKDSIDLRSRLKATQLLQDRLQQLIQYRDDHPLSIGLGLYQGDAIEAKVRGEYFKAMRQLMLNPVHANLEAFLNDVDAHAAQLHTGAGKQDTSAQAGAQGGMYQDASPTNTSDAYGALKTYLMLGPGHPHLDTSLLSDQLTRYWRGWLEANRGAMPREDMIRRASGLIAFYLSQAHDKHWPAMDNSLTLVDTTRGDLRKVMRGMPARDRVYADIKARASARFPTVTVASILGDDSGKHDLLTGSHAIPGAFSREAWEQYVKDAFANAANKELSNNDWVLDTTVKDDLTLSGSPEHIQKALVGMYKKDYAKQWQQFLSGVAVVDFGNFNSAVKDMNTLGDVQHSPLKKLMDEVYRQTAWDMPKAVDDTMKKASGGVLEWFQRNVLGRTRASRVTSSVDADKVVEAGAKAQKARMGAVGKAFSGLARLMKPRANSPSLMDGYMANLGKIRTRFNAIKNQGDPGPGARKLMQQTLDSSGSPLSATLTQVNEQMLNGLSTEQRKALRPLLLRPLVQAYAALVPPTEAELNHIWKAQVFKPFEQNLAQKYPFADDSRVEAAPGEIGQLFGPQGAIAKFGSDALGQLVVRRGTALSPRQWADISINLSPQLVAHYGTWVSPLDQSGVPTAGAVQQTTFQIRPKPGYGLNEYSIQIDGQRLRYRNTPPQWSTFVWPASKGTPGVSVKAVTSDGRNVVLFDSPGRGGLTRLFQTGSPQKIGDDKYNLSWSKGGAKVSVELRIISSPQATADGSLQNGLQGLQLPRTVAGAASAETTAGASTGEAAR